ELSGRPLGAALTLCISSRSASNSSSLNAAIFGSEPNQEGAASLLAKDQSICVPTTDPGVGELGRELELSIFSASILSMTSDGIPLIVRECSGEARTDCRSLSRSALASSGLLNRNM